MENTKTTNLKRLAVFILMLVMLIGMFPISAFAGDSVFLETLINTDKQTYVANFTSDTKNKNRKYAFKYINMGYFLGKGCDDETHEKQGKNPNYCFTLNSTSRYDDIAGDNHSGLSIFMSLEGFIRDGTDNTLIKNENDIDKANDDKRNFYKNIVKTSGAWKKGNPLSYPGYNTETVTNEQAEYAQETLSTLVASLNGILNTVNDGKKYASTPELVNKSIAIRPDNDNNITYLKQTLDANGNVNYQGFVIVYADLQGSPTKETSVGEANRKLAKMDLTTINATSSSSSILDNLVLPRGNQDGCLYAYVFPISSGTDPSSIKVDPKAANVFVYAVPKGFMDLGSFYTADFTDGGETFDYVTENKEVPWITIHMLSMYANTVYKQENVSINTYVEPDQGVIPQILSGMFKGLMWALRGILGLTEIETLVFNLGSRGSSSYNYGLMSENWWNVVLQYQLIFQAIAWVILVCGFIKTLIELNLSTVNPQKRMNLFDTIQKFIVVGIGLVILIPCVQFMLECNNVIVDLFASQIDTSVLNMPLVSNWLVQILVGFAWIMLLLYINFLYIMRSVTVALLIASGPFFIATISWGHGKSSLFSSWARELIANIFVQSVHAFVLSFLCQLLSTGSFLETFAIAISIIPLTEMFRGLIFAGAGGSTSQMANSAASATTKMGTSAVKGLVGGANTAIGLATAGKSEGDGGGGGGGKDGKEGGTSTGNLQKQAQSTLAKLGNGTGAGSKIRQKAEERRAAKGKEGAGALGKTLGGIADAGSVALAAGMMGMSALPDMMDTMQGMSDLMLKGDASSLGKAIEKNGSNAVNRAAGNAAAIGGMVDNYKSRKGTKSTSTMSNMSSSQGVAQVLTESKGKTAGGATVTTSASGVKEEKEFYSSDETVAGDNVADLRGSDDQTRAQAMNAFNAAGEKGKQVRSALVPQADGTFTKAQMYSYRDADNHERHFIMEQGQVQAATSGASKATGKFDHGSAAKVGKGNNVMPAMSTQVARHAEPGEADGKNDLHMAMVQEYGEKKAKTSANATYYDSEGKTGSFKTYNGEDYFIRDGASYANIDTAIADRLERGEFVDYQQRQEEFVQSMAKQGTEGANGTITMPTTSIAGMTNAAMVTALGKQIDGHPGTYQFGGKTWETGMSKQTAEGVLRTQGISVPTTQQGSGGTFVQYSQRGGERTTTTPFLAAASQSNGTMIGRYDLNIGATSAKSPAPQSFAADGKGGGTLTFASQGQAAQYMMSHGNIGMAEQILKAKDGSHQVSDIHTFNNTSSGFSISFNGQEMQKQGMSMGTSQDGQSIYVSSAGREVPNIFDLDANTVHTYEQNVEATAQAEQQARAAQIQAETRTRLETEDAYREEMEAARKAAEAARNGNPLETN